MTLIRAVPQSIRLSGVVHPEGQCRSGARIILLPPTLAVGDTERI